MGALKLTDALLMPLTREEHGKAEKDRHTYFQMGLSKAISDLFDPFEFRCEIIDARMRVQNRKKEIRRRRSVLIHIKRSL